MFEQLGSETRERARRVRWLALDVDGVLTDGRLIYTAEGESLKRFHVRDGLGVRLLSDQGYRVVVISARSGAALRRRLQELGVVDAILGTHDKLSALEELARVTGLPLEACAFVGDDLWDLPALRAVGLPICVADGHALVQREAKYITRAPGGTGAVREVADMLLSASGRLEHAAEQLISRPAQRSFGVIIPARYAATRLPGKPLREIAGKPMILHVCDNARDSGARFVWVATDDPRIERVVADAGVEVLLTSTEHRSGTDRLAEVVRNKELGPGEVVVNVQGDEPLLPSSLIRLTAEGLGAHPLASIATLAAPITTKAEFDNPNIVKVVLNRLGYAEYFSRAALPFVRDPSDGAEGGAAPPLEALRHIGIYAYRVDALLQMAAQPPVMQEVCESLEQLRALWLGLSIHVGVVEQAPSHGVDTEDDLRRVSELLSQRQLDRARDLDAGRSDDGV